MICLLPIRLCQTGMPGRKSAGVDPHFRVELIADGSIAAVASRVDLADFSPDRLRGQDGRRHPMAWNSRGPAQRNHLPVGPAVRPFCRCGLARCFVRGTRCGPVGALPIRSWRIFWNGSVIVREWGVKLYIETGHKGTGPCSGGQTPSVKNAAADDTVPSAMAGTNYLTRKKAEFTERRQRRAEIDRMVQTVERQLAAQAERSCRIRNLSGSLTGRAEEMVFNAAFLQPAASQANWLETVRGLERDIRGRGLTLEASGPWPPYHFCPSPGVCRRLWRFIR